MRSIHVIARRMTPLSSCFLGRSVCCSLDFQHQALEVFGFRQVENDGMVGRGAAALEKAYAPL